MTGKMDRGMRLGSTEARMDHQQNSAWPQRESQLTSGSNQLSRESRRDSGQRDGMFCQRKIKTCDRGKGAEAALFFCPQRESAVTPPSPLFPTPTAACRERRISMARARGLERLSDSGSGLMRRGTQSTLDQSSPL